MPALANFLRDELHRRNWSIEEFAKRADLSTSLGYQIIRDGKDNVRRATFEGIALALGMTPAELMIAIGKGAVSDDPRRAVAHARLRQVPDENLDTLDLMLAGLTVKAAQHRTTYRKDPSANRLRKALRKHDVDNRNDEKEGNQGGVSSVWKAITRLFNAQPRALVGASVNS